jgi:beta-glucosidase
MSTPLYKNPTQPVATRVRDLLRHMTLAEKVGQLLQPEYGWQACRRQDGQIVVAEAWREQIVTRGIGALYGLFRADPWTRVTLAEGLGPQDAAAAANAVQRLAVEESRLGIPLLLSEECPHGHMAIGATVFPAGLTMGASWNPALLERVWAAIGAELRARGIGTGYGPVLDLAYDPRWSRCEECFGEDPWHAAELGAAAVRGLQAPGPDGRHVLATLKHFAGHGANVGGRNGAQTNIGEHQLREELLVPFRAAIRAGAQSLMSAYNDIDGVPATADHWLLTELLREEWGFEGFVVSDGGAVDMLMGGHRVAGSPAEAAAKAVHAGVDLALWGVAFDELDKAVRAGTLALDELDTAVRRVLTAKFRLGLFEHPYIEAAAASVIACPAHLELATDIARQGLVLVKNDGAVLPLRADLATVAVVGPNADAPYNQLGDYTAPQPLGRVVTVLDGLRQVMSAECTLLHAPGCRVRLPGREGFPAALEAARQADAVIAVLGGSSARDFSALFADTGAALPGEDGSDMDCGEGFDRCRLDLPGEQLALLHELKALGKPLIVVLIKGRPLELAHVADYADAILDAGYPGQMGGQAIAEALVGRVNPGGRLAMSVPRSVGQLPVYRGLHPQSWSSPYVENEKGPLYPFGWGLSYTEFSYSELRLSRKRMAVDGELRASVHVTNTGPCEGDEVVQWYLTDHVASVARPERVLRHFQRLRLAPGASTTVRFIIRAEHLMLVNDRLEEVVEPGTFTVQVGGRPDMLLGIDFTV